MSALPDSSFWRKQRGFLTGRAGLKGGWFAPRLTVDWSKVHARGGNVGALASMQFAAYQGSKGSS